MDRLLKVVEVAEVIGVEKTTVYRLIHDGALPYTNVGRGKQRPRIRIRASVLQAYLASRERTAA